MAEALVLGPTEEPGRPEEAPAADTGESGAPGASARRERIAALVQRIENGDLSATSTLRELLLDK